MSVGDYGVHGTKDGPALPERAAGESEGRGCGLPKGGTTLLEGRGSRPLNRSAECAGIHPPALVPPVTGHAVGPEREPPGGKPSGHGDTARMAGPGTVQAGAAWEGEGRSHGYKGKYGVRGQAAERRRRAKRGRRLATAVMRPAWKKGSAAPQHRSWGRKNSHGWRRTSRSGETPCTLGDRAHSQANF